MTAYAARLSPELLSYVSFDGEPVAGEEVTLEDPGMRGLHATTVRRPIYTRVASLPHGLWFKGQTMRLVARSDPPRLPDRQSY